MRRGKVPGPCCCQGPGRQRDAVKTASRQASIGGSSSPVKCLGLRGEQNMKCRDHDDCIVTFSRYITAAGRVLDAHDYGYRAWPIHSRGKAA